MVYISRRGFFLVLICFVFTIAVASAEAQRRRLPQAPGGRRVEERGGQRIRPPETLQCPRNNLTSFTGRVLFYHRNNNRISIRVRTDWDTTEQFTLRYAEGDDPAKWFLMRGEAFGPDDWQVIEARRGRLRRNIRATIWVCNDGTRPVIDWQPPHEES